MSFIKARFQADTCKLRWFCVWEQLGGISAIVREKFSIGNSEGKGEESARREPENFEFLT